MRGGVYARLSDPHRKGVLRSDETSLSIQTQIQHCQDKAKQLGIRIDDEC